MRSVTKKIKTLRQVVAESRVLALSEILRRPQTRDVSKDVGHVAVLSFEA